MPTSTLFKHPIRTSNNQTPLIVYLKQTDIYIYDDPFGNENTYIFTYGGADIHPDNLTPTTETCHTSFTMTSCFETQQNISAENNTQNKSILSMQDLTILHAKNIYPQS
jgi:hypothetical protein